MKERVMRKELLIVAAAILAIATPSVAAQKRSFTASRGTDSKRDQA
jgi:hypothetical protein